MNVKDFNLIIQKLGYLSCEGFYFYHEMLSQNILNYHYTKILKILKPEAVFLFNNKPFILFFKNINLNDDLRKKIWNSQIPLTFFVNDYDIKIYNSNSFVNDNVEELEKISINLSSNRKLNIASQYDFFNINNDLFWKNQNINNFSNNLPKLLLDNIEYLTSTLKEDYKIQFANRLVLRLIFIRFLIDRGVDIGYKLLNSDIEKSREELLRIVTNKEELFDLFSYLNKKFKGELFDYSLDENNVFIDDNCLNYIKEFLSGQEVLKNQQLSLFPLYDFNIISTELISNIYEILLGKQKQKNDKAFYTPGFLVEYILKDTVDEFLISNNQCKVLDPSCGSGVFLVESLRRIIEKNSEKNSFIGDDNLLIRLLKDNIYGVDLNSESIEIAIFSLYITLLDYKDPKALKGFNFPKLINTNLFAQDFFSDVINAKLSNVKFDFILGNPPWGNIKGPHIKYCKDMKVPNQNNEISRSFIIKTLNIASNNTIVSLVLPSKILYNTENKAVLFRKFLLENYNIIDVLELSSVRKLIFKNAIAPATVIRLNKKNVTKKNINYTSVKPSSFFHTFQILSVNKIDNKKIPQNLLLEHDWAWKTMVFGNKYDFEIIKNLKDKYFTIRDFIKTSKLIEGTGIQYDDGKYSSKHLVGLKLLNAKDLNPFQIKNNIKEVFRKEKVARIRKQEIFKGPLCLIKGGVSSNYTNTSVYTEEDILYKKAIKGIKGGFLDKNILLNFVGFINSNFYAYLNLMLAPSIGIEREQSIFENLYDFPINPSEKIATAVLDIQNALKNNVLKDNHSQIKNLESLILKQFELENNSFINYALNITIPSLTQKNKNWMITDNELLEYAEFINNYFKSKVNYQIKIDVFNRVKSLYTVLKLNFSKANVEKEKMIEVKEQDDKIYDLLLNLIIQDTDSKFFRFNQVISYNNDSIIIAKTCEKKNWQIANANIDVSEILSYILKDGGI